MNAISKRLLSFVIVLAMVLSMSPVITLPAAAATEDPLTVWNRDYASLFTDKTENVETNGCPFCGDEGTVTWYPRTSGGFGHAQSYDSTNKVLTGKKHFYFASDFDYLKNSNTSGMNLLDVRSTSGTICLNTNGKTVNFTGRLRVANEVHIFGGGTLNQVNNYNEETVTIQDYAFFPIENATDLHIYDGTYTTERGVTTNFPGGAGIFDTGADRADAKVTIHGGTFKKVNGAIGPIVSMRYKYTVDMYGGEITGGTGLVDGTTYYTDENSATHYGTQGGNVYMVSGNFNMHGGSIYGGTATGIKDDAAATKGGRGGNVYISKDATFNMDGGKIYGGKVEVFNGGNSYGGNVMLYHSTARLNMSGDAEIYGGQATNGGNVQLRSNNEMTMSGNAKVYNGKASSGPNIYLMNGSNPKLTMSGNATVYGGKNLSDETMNIRMYGGTLVMEDNATVLGGEGTGSAISVHYEQNPLIVLKDKATVKSETGNIEYQINNGRILITDGWDGEVHARFVLEDGSRVYSYGEQIDTACALRGTYNEETDAVEAADVSFTGKLYSGTIEALADSAVVGGIKLAEKSEPVFGVFDPETYEGMAYCEACYKQAIAAGKSDTEAKEAALVEWTAYDYKYNTNTELKTDDTHEHLYLTENLTAFTNTRLVNMNAGTICLNLNGKSITKDPTASRGALFFTQGDTAVLNIMDETMEGKGASVLIGAAPNNIARGAAFRVEKGTCNVYGGTFKDLLPFYYQTKKNETTGETEYVLDENGDKVVGGNIWRVATVLAAGTLNLYEGAVIDGSNESSTRQTVSVDGGILNLDGGEIIGRLEMNGTSGSAVCVEGGGTFNMKSGSIHDGVAGVLDNEAAAVRCGGNVSITENSTFNMSGGKIYGGKATSSGGNVYVSGSTFNMSGGEIYDGTSTGEETDNVYISASTMIMSGKAKVTGDGTRYSALFVGGANDSASTLVLKDEASVLSATGTYSAGLLGVTHSRTGTSSTIVIDPSWTGEACAYLYRYYQREDESWTSTGLTNGDEVERGVAVGTYDVETGNITPSNEINGNLYAMGETKPVWVAEDGTIYIPGVSVEIENSRTWYADLASALAAYDIADKAYIGLWMNGDVALTEDAYVAAMRGNLAFNVTGSGNLYMMDTAQDDYAGTSSTWTVADGVSVVRDVKNPVSAVRYLNVTNTKGEGTQTINSYCLNMFLSTVSLRAAKTEEMGLYYKATVSMSEALAAKIKTHGVVLSLVDMPGADFMEELETNANENGFTAIEATLGVNADNNYTVTLNSGSVFGIMKADENKKADNAARGEMDIYANAYLEIDLDGDGTTEFVMSETDDVAWSLFDVLDTIDTDWDKYEAAQTKVKEFYTYWAQFGMDAWANELPKIAA